MSTLTLYMKSGNKIKLKGISDWKVTSTNGRIATLNVTYKKNVPTREQLIFNSLDLTQVEAITETVGWFGK